MKLNNIEISIVQLLDVPSKYCILSDLWLMHSIIFTHCMELMCVCGLIFDCVYESILLRIVGRCIWPTRRTCVSIFVFRWLLFPLCHFSRKTNWSTIFFLGWVKWWCCLLGFELSVNLIEARNFIVLISISETIYWAWF